MSCILTHVASSALGTPFTGPCSSSPDRRVLEHPVVREIADRHGRSVPQVIFRFTLALGMIPLTGTTDPEHMPQDLAVYESDLDADEVEAIEQLEAA